MANLLAVVRIRSSIGVSKDKRDTLRLLNLNFINNCVLLSKTPSILGMLEKVKDLITYGEINKETLVNLLKNRLRVIGNKKIDESNLKLITKFNSFEEFAEALLEGRVRLKDFPKLKKVFGLKPPRGGFKNVKEFYPKGDLGYRGEEINDLINRMI